MVRLGSLSRLVRSSKEAARPATWAALTCCPAQVAPGRGVGLPGSPTTGFGADDAGHFRMAGAVVRGDTAPDRRQHVTDRSIRSKSAVTSIRIPGARSCSSDRKTAVSIGAR